MANKKRCLAELAELTGQSIEELAPAIDQMCKECHAKQAEAAGMVADAASTIGGLSWIVSYLEYCSRVGAELEEAMRWQAARMEAGRRPFEYKR